VYALYDRDLSFDSEAEETRIVISGAHVVIYSKNAEADHRFIRDVLGFGSVDAGHGWLVFELPPAEAAVHPASENDRHELYLMCPDLKKEMEGSAVRRNDRSAVGPHYKDELTGRGEDCPV
jgi:hypothetical protein